MKKDINFKAGQAKAFICTLNEFDEFLGKISDGKVGAKSESGEWFYVITEDISDEEILEMIGKSLDIHVTNVIVDITKDNVAITY